MRFTLLDGETIDASRLSRRDLEFLLDLLWRTLADQPASEVGVLVAGHGAYPLKGRERVTTRVSSEPLYRVANDIFIRLAIRQGRMGATETDDVPVDDVVSVSEAASMLGVSRAAVIKALKRGRFQGRKIGKTWVLVRRSVERYEVTRSKVEAGRAAHRPRRRAARSA